MDRVRHILFYAALKPSGNLMLAEMGDGALAILRDDQVVEGERWPRGDELAAVARFQELKASLAAEGKLR